MRFMCSMIMCLIDEGAQFVLAPRDARGPTGGRFSGNAFPKRGHSGASDVRSVMGC